MTNKEIDDPMDSVQLSRTDHGFFVTDQGVLFEALLYGAEKLAIWSHGRWPGEPYAPAAEGSDVSFLPEAIQQFYKETAID